MLNRLIRWSLQNRWLVVFLGLAMFLYGVYAATRTPVDVFPDFAPVQVIVQTEAPGYAPEEVESLVTLPLESAINGTANVQTVRSISTVGLSVITAIFKEGTNVFTARQMITEKLGAASRSLPPGVAQPVLAPISTAVADTLKLGFVSETGATSPMDLRTLADWTVRPRLMAVPGVANVVTYGSGRKQYQVLADPAKLSDYGISMQEVIAAARNSNINAAGGYLRSAEREFLIRGVGRVHSADEIARTVVTARNGTPVTLAQVADVQVGPELAIGDAVIDGKPGVILHITKQPWANTLETTYGLEKALSELQSGFPADVKVIPTFRQADFIEVAVYNVLEALILGGVLVMLVLFVFLRNWRTALITLTAIPLSLLAAIIALHWQGGTINTMTLGGLTIAIGEVVDDAIVDVENVYRRLRENRLAGSPRHPLQVVYDASREIRTSIIYATWIVALVFLPIFSLGGLEGRIFTPLAFAYIVAIVASLGVALTVTPAMCYLLLGRSAHLPEGEGRTIDWLKERYRRILQPCLAQPRKTLAGALALLVVSLVPLGLMGREFLPEFDESNLIVVTNAIPGTSLDTTVQTGRRLTTHLKKHGEVLSVGQRAGRAEGGEDYGGSNFSEYDIRLTNKGVDKKDIIHHVRDDFSRVPGLVVNVGSYISHRMDHVLSGVNAQIAVKLFGPDMDVLRRKAERIESVLRGVRGAVDVQMEPLIPIPQVTIHIDRDAAALYGVQVGAVAESIEAAYKGISVSRVLEGQKSFDLLVWLAPEARNNLDAIRATLLDTPSGAKVPLGNVAQVGYGESPNAIRHENASRHVVIQANVSGRDLGGVIQEARGRIAEQVPLDAGYYVQYGGQFEAQEKASRQLLLFIVLAVLGIFGLLVMAFRSVRAVGLMMANLPLAMIGGIWAMLAFGGVMSVGSLVGFITLFGISTRNGILLVSHFNHLLAEGKSMDEVLWQGSLDRLSPVLMTALTAALGVLPIALLGGAGRELEQPMAVVILGGMLSSTALTLVVIPALFKLYGGHALQPAALDADPVIACDETDGKETS